MSRSTLASQIDSLGETHPSSLDTMVVLARTLDGQHRPASPTASPPFYIAKHTWRKFILHVFEGPGYGLHVKMILRPQ